MSGALTLIILVASGESDDATSRAILRATRAALGAQAHVEVRETRDPASDSQALAAEQRSHADAVVELTWTETGHRQATLRVHLARDPAVGSTSASGGRWLDRSIGFQPSDKDAERGRTVGFAVASMIPEAMGGLEVETTPSPAASPPSAPVAPSAQPQPMEPAPPASLAKPPVTDQAVSSPLLVAPAATRRRLDVVAIDVVGVGAANGDILDVGAVGALQWFPASWFSLRLGGGARAGNIPAAEATTLTLLGSAGAALHGLRASAARPFGWWIGADYVVERPSLTHFSQGTQAPVTAQRWLSGMDVLVGVEWRFAPEVGVLLALGGEDVFSTTYVQVRGVEAATLSPLRSITEAGFRLGF